MIHLQGLVYPLLAGLVILAVPSPAGAEWVDWIAEAEIDTQFTDNLNISAFSEDEEDDFSWHPMAKVGRVYQLTDRTRVSVTAEISGDVYEEFTRLDAVEGGGRLALFHKFGIGNAPWARASFFGGYKDVREGDRSGSRLEVGLNVGKRFSPRFDATFSYLFTDRDGGNGPATGLPIGTDVFDQQYHLIGVSWNFLLLQPLLVSAGYTFRVGEFDSACTPGNVAKVLAKADVEAIAFDSVFGGCVYRLEGTGHSTFVNFSYGLTDRLSLDVGYQFQHGDADDLDYDRNSARLSVIFRY